MKNNLFLLIFCVFLNFSSKGQSTYLSVGYQFGNLGRGVHSFQNEVYFLNHSKTYQFSEPLSYSSFVNGLNLGLFYGEREANSFYFFWNWSNSHLIATGTGTNTLLNQEVDVHIKYRHNFINVTGFGYQVTKWFGVGYSPVDLGKLVVYYKNSGDEQFKSYKDFYDVEKGFLSDYTIYGSSYYLDFFIKEKFKISLNYYKSWQGVHLRSRNEVTTENYYNADRFNFSLNYLFLLKD